MSQLWMHSEQCKFRLFKLTICLVFLGWTISSKMNVGDIHLSKQAEKNQSKPKYAQYPSAYGHTVTEDHKFGCDSCLHEYYTKASAKSRYSKDFLSYAFGCARDIIINCPHLNPWKAVAQKSQTDRHSFNRFSETNFSFRPESCTKSSVAHEEFDQTISCTSTAGISTFAHPKVPESQKYHPQDLRNLPSEFVQTYLKVANQSQSPCEIPEDLLFEFLE